MSAALIFYKPKACSDPPAYKYLQQVMGLKIILFIVSTEFTKVSFVWISFKCLLHTHSRENLIFVSSATRGGNYGRSEKSSEEV